ncbi:phage prohead protease, HK97 family protein [Pseudoxanthomonas spadix BD-a59]|uniref:Phage prohead protease, HK97 family protein n=2 Tax=Pseudoxanthomonas spadix TaxID=415229 RepID=G7UQ44_PSEUP|nr:phage prohead protease, HK97 family protein [Pseudoxanthomonas spadix BD-a59]
MSLARKMIEQRFAHEVRASGRTLSGYVARFGTEARIGSFVEVIKPGAFRASLDSGADVLALADHDPSRVLGRTRSGTLHLAEDGEGLAFSLQLPDTQAGRDLVALAERGDLGGCSFGFTVGADGERWTGNKRELRAVTLHEVSIVQSWPAYDGTSANLRHRMPHADHRRLWLETV